MLSNSLPLVQSMASFAHTPKQAEQTPFEVRTALLATKTCAHFCLNFLASLQLRFDLQA